LAEWRFVAVEFIEETDAGVAIAHLLDICIVPLILVVSALVISVLSIAPPCRDRSLSPANSEEGRQPLAQPILNGDGEAPSNRE
jgi:hypothetical protein